MAKINPTVCLLCSVIVLTTVINLSSGSAIIIWEYLSRGEKVILISIICFVSVWSVAVPLHNPDINIWVLG